MKTLKIFLGAIFGFLFAFIVYALGFKFPALIEFAVAPAEWIFDKWHQMGLPPQSEAAFVGPLFTLFILWTLIGLIAGIIWAIWKKPDRASSKPVNKPAVDQ